MSLLINRGIKKIIKGFVFFLEIIKIKWLPLFFINGFRLILHRRRIKKKFDFCLQEAQSLLAQNIELK